MDTLIMRHYEVLKMEAKKAIYAMKCHKEDRPWKVYVRFKDGRLIVTRDCGDHTCGALTLGSDHTMTATS